MRRIWLVLVLALAAYSAEAPARKVAITFDDLPRGGDDPPARTYEAARPMTEKLMRNLGGVPVTGFVNPRNAPMSEEEMQAILQLWSQAGAELGNHTATHKGLNQTPLEEYLADIEAAEPSLRKARGGKRSVYFRHPFLQAGPTKEKKDGLDRYLREQGYVMAPVTIDNCDYLIAHVYAAALKKGDGERVKKIYLDYMDRIFAFFEQRSIEVVGREMAQVLMLHANQLNADAMPELLAMMKRRGYAVVPLEEALRDEAYRQKDEYLGTNGISWLHRWAKTKGMKAKGEPADPPEIVAEYEKLQRR